MKRFTIVALFVLILTPGRAEALWWDWIKELSGPGPSQSEGNGLATLCISEWPHLGDPLHPPPPDAKIKKVPCIFIDGRTYVNGEDDNFPNRVRIRAWDFGITWKLLHERIEIGSGLGFMQFDSADRITNNGLRVTTRKFTLTTPRIVAVPVRLFFPMIPDKGWPGRLSRLLKFHARMNIIPGTIDATDFGVPVGTAQGQSTFRAVNDAVWSSGFIVDIGELFRR